MKLIWLPVLAGAALLAGCAGGKSTFECGATAEDQCMTILQANEKAALKTQSKQAGGAQQLPVVAEPSAKNTLMTPGTMTGNPAGKTAGVVVPPATTSTVYGNGSTSGSGFSGGVGRPLASTYAPSWR